MRTLILMLLLLGSWLPVAAATKVGDLIPAKKLYSNPAAGHFALAPSGQQLSFIAVKKNEHALQVVDTDSLAVVRSISFENTGKVQRYQWLSDQRVLVFLRGNNGDEIRLLLDLSAQEVTSKRLPVAGEIVALRFRDVDHDVLYAREIIRNDEKIAELVVVDIDALAAQQYHQAQVVASRELQAYSFVYDAQFDKLVAFHLDQAQQRLILRYADRGQDNWRDAISYALDGDDDLLVPLGFAEPDAFAVLSDQDTDTKALRIFDIARGQLRDEVIYQHPRYDLTAASFATDGSLYSVSYRQDGLLHTEYFDQPSQQLFSSLRDRFAQREIRLISASDDAQLVIFYTNGAQDPGHYYLFDRQHNLVHPLEASYPELTEYQFSASKLLQATAVDGSLLEGYWNQPQGGIDLQTLIVMPHGGPIGVRDDDRFHADVQYLTSRGFSVLRVNFRGSAGFGKAFREQGVGQFGQLIEDDITSMVDTLLAQQAFKHICAMGNSYGAYSAAMLAIRQPQRYQCVIGGFGIYDLALVFNSSNYRATADYRDRVSDTVGTYEQRLIEVSPVYLAKQLQAPMLIIAGELDRVADFEHSQRLRLVLQQHDADVEFLHYKTARHGHYYWWGDWHDAVARYDFLLRQLQLPYPAASAISVADRRTLAEEFALYGDGFQMSKQLPEQPWRAKQAYAVAADYGDSAALFWLSQLTLQLQRGADASAEALDYLQRAAAAHEQRAHKQLSQIYARGLHGVQDLALAQQHLAALNDQTLSPLERDFAALTLRCLQQVDEAGCLAPYQQRIAEVLAVKKDQAWRDDSLARILLQADLTDTQRQQLWQPIATHIGYTRDAEATRTVTSGVFEFRRYGNERYPRLSQSNQVALSEMRQSHYSNDAKTLLIGAKLRLELAGYETFSDKTMIIAHWQQFDRLSGQLLSDQFELVQGNTGSEWRLTQGDLLANTEWLLRVYNVKGQELFQQRYEILP